MFTGIVEAMGEGGAGQKQPDGARRFGGHFVQGHVDGVGTVTRVTPEGDGVWMEVNLPPGLSRYVAEKGSVALDGGSLTVAAVQDSRRAVALVPPPLAATTRG